MSEFGLGALVGGTTTLLAAFLGFYSARRQMRRKAISCTCCNDTGMLPGDYSGSLVIMPAPCTHCVKGKEIAAGIMQSLDMGGLPPVQQDSKTKLLDALRSERRQAECIPVDDATIGFLQRVESFVEAVL